MASVRPELTVSAVRSAKQESVPLVDHALFQAQFLLLEVADLLGGAQLTMIPFLERVLPPPSYLCPHATILLVLCVLRSTAVCGPVHPATFLPPLALDMAARTHRVNAGFRVILIL